MQCRDPRGKYRIREFYSGRVHHSTIKPMGIMMGCAMLHPSYRSLMLALSIDVGEDMRP